MSERAAPGTAKRRMDDAMSEDDLLDNVLDLAQRGGWLAFHPKPASVMQRGRYVRLTHQIGSMGVPDPKRYVAGYPDLTLTRDHVVLFPELKAEDGALSAEQRLWLAHLGPLGVVWRPRDLPEIRRILLAPRTAPVQVPPPRATAARRDREDGRHPRRRPLPPMPGDPDYRPGRVVQL